MEKFNDFVYNFEYIQNILIKLNLHNTSGALLLSIRAGFYAIKIGWSYFLDVEHLLYYSQFIFNAYIPVYCYEYCKSLFTTETTTSDLIFPILSLDTSMHKVYSWNIAHMQSLYFKYIHQIISCICFHFIIAWGCVIFPFNPLTAPIYQLSDHKMSIWKRRYIDSPPLKG